MHGHVDAGVVFNERKNAEVLLQYAAVATMTVCVTFCAPCFGQTNSTICIRSGYVTFCTISATAVREMAVCVTFGAPHFGFPVPSWRHPTVDHADGVSHGSVISGIVVLILY